MPLLDEHGFTTGEVPIFIGEHNLARWVICAGIATRITRLPIEDPECSMFAQSIFYSEFPTGPVEQIPRHLLEAVDPEWDESKHLRNRLGRYIDMPDGPRAAPAPESKVGGAIPNAPNAPKVAVPTLDEIENLGLNTWPEPTAATRKVIGDHNTTQAKYAAGPSQAPDDGSPVWLVPYAPERKATHDSIIDSFKAGKTPVPEGVERRATFTAGGPSSGKTTTLRRLMAAGEEITPPEENTIHIDPDAIKESLPEYQALVKAGDRYAASAVHKESGDIAGRLMLEAIAEGYHVVIDQTGDGAEGNLRKMLDFMHGEGYAVELVYVNQPTDKAVQLAVKRAGDTGRFVPIPEIRRQHKRVSGNFMSDVIDWPHLRGLDIIHEGKHVAMWNEEAGNLHIIDRDGFLAFVAKADEKGA